jgi:hypothetical protein
VTIMPSVGSQIGDRTLRSATAAAVIAPTTSRAPTSQVHFSNTEANGSAASMVAPAATRDICLR